MTLLVVSQPLMASAGEVRVVPGEEPLQQVIDRARDGDTVSLGSGSHRGPVVIDKPIALTGESGAHLAGDGQGSVVTIDSPNVTVAGLRITGSGSSHETIDSGIKLTDMATASRVLDNRLEGNLVGVDVHGAQDALVARNVIIGRQDHRMNARGNGVYIWNAPGTIVEDNDIRLGRDGIFVNTSKQNIFRNNRFSDLRFAIHYMYTNDSEVSGNVSSNNHAGYALMYSDRNRVVGNVSLNDRDHGIFLNYVNRTVVEGNIVRRGETKCLFIYNAHKNTVSENRFEGCGLGIHFTAGSERNALTGNAFVGNRIQVKYVGSRWLDWSAEGTGNFWSDHASFDLDGDGIADQPYRPNDLIDRILWTRPSARLLLGSPAVQLIRWAQSKFPSLLPGGVVDTRPLAAPPPMSLDRGVASIAGLNP